MVDPVEVYGADRVGTRWAVVDALHPNAVGHRGVDFRLPDGGGSPVPTYERGVVVSTPFSPILGYCTVIRLDDGRFAYWAHLRGGTRPNIGTVLEPGDLVGLAATGGTWLPQMDPDFPGTAWAGCHIHTGIGPLMSSVFSGITYDPLPRIQASLYALAGSGITPITAGDTTATEITMTYDEFRDFLRRGLKYDVREGETTGATIWERFSALGSAISGLATVAKTQDTRREQINQRNEDIHTAQGAKLDAILAAVKSNGTVTIALSDEDAAKIAAQIQPASGPSIEEIRAAVNAELANLVLAPRA